MLKKGFPKKTQSELSPQAKVKAAKSPCGRDHSGQKEQDGQDVNDEESMRLLEKGK